MQSSLAELVQTISFFKFLKEFSPLKLKYLVPVEI